MYLPLSLFVFAAHECFPGRGIVRSQFPLVSLQNDSLSLAWIAESHCGRSCTPTRFFWKTGCCSRHQNPGANPIFLFAYKKLPESEIESHFQKTNVNSCADPTQRCNRCFPFGYKLCLFHLTWIHGFWRNLPPKRDNKKKLLNEPGLGLWRPF